MRLFFLMSTIALLAAPSAAFGDGIPLDRLTIAGQVQGENGQGVAGVRVYVNGEDYETTTDQAGNYELLIPLHEFGNFKSKTKIRIKAKGKKTTFHTTTRQATLALDIKRESRRGNEHCQIRGNQERLVRMVGEAINRGEPELQVRSIHFVHPVRAARRLTMKAKNVVIMGKKKTVSPATSVSPAPSSAAPPAVAAGAAAGVAALPAPASRPEPTPTSASRPMDATAQVRRVGEPAGTASPSPTPATTDVVKLPGPGVKQTDAATIRRLPPEASAATVAVGARALADVLPRDDGCECRIRGTVELHPDHLLTGRLQVLVSLTQASAVRDTVELFMGSPRAFELRPLRCADWNLNVEAVSKRDFTVVSVDGSEPVRCAQGGLQQLRIVLAPR